MPTAIDNKPQQKKPINFLLPLLLLGPLLYLTLFQKKPEQAISYSAFKEKVTRGEIKGILFKENDILAQGKDEKSFQTTMPTMGDENLMPLLEQHAVEIKAESSNSPLFVTIVINLLPWLLIFGFFYYSSRNLSKNLGQFRQGSGMFGIGRDVKFHPKKDHNLSFKDVAGCNHAKQDLQEIVDFLKNPNKYKDIGASLPKGILMMGPPGTGKTLMAKACAGEADVPFFSMSGSEFIELFVGMGASRVRDLFQRAKKEAPSIIFIDEIDSIGRSRGTGLGGGHDEREQTLNQILSEMDGFSSDDPVVVIAATNRPDVLDTALTRPGRFDRQVILDLPQKKARQEILQIHTRKIPLEENVNLELIAKATVGFSGADLKNLANEAALLAARKGKKTVSLSDFNEARDKVIMGNPREEMLNEKDKKIVAVHESGHALIAHLTKDADPLHQISIIPRGRALGATQQSPEEDRYNISRSYLLGRIGILLGGRMAERLTFGEITTGAEDDLKQCTKLARKMVMNWGMSEKLGEVSFRQGEEHIFLGKEIAHGKEFSEKTAEIIDDEVEKIINERKAWVDEQLKTNKDKLLKLSDTLLEKETLDKNEIEEILG